MNLSPASARAKRKCEFCKIPESRSGADLLEHPLEETRAPRRAEEWSLLHEKVSAGWDRHALSRAARVLGNLQNF